ncbi:tRNA uridine(34) 5-carboxymethylaminomethyl modification radical SAM/GNAT enzyme Elp3 [Methanocella sp. CWC-04]|uniref:tRNA carboxymethyluridine synthase n=1 Tax=Methanooceanicella nereidis TaxID=2052831 RepID=A0AAP2RCR8_9EURY|nr:tRNA uridine(34) 5-carboxymethylaminomethyl modification radical SAM/GNAT enzyme Elp3 [Methanocella sp. CWC-04]MCD1295156.1 tRNA uridine(34) 5-carboxymethylaminomethyl modification radical SAM/GNAT enzyme Elp3 [Methanocella sp. CWC-04]
MNEMQIACRELVELIISGDVTTQDGLNSAKKQVSIAYHLPKLPRNSDILAAATDIERETIISLLQKRPVRTISGVAVVAVMTSPYKCPHGKCIPCPGGVDSVFNSPQSYTGAEPAALRAIQENYDPYRQVTARLTQLKQIGHELDKVELIIMGGTMTARSIDYQEWFVRRCFEAMNDFGLPGPVEHTGFIEDAQKINEDAAVRNVAMTFETRPDWCKEHHIDRMLNMGGTKVEVGVQSIYDFILKRIERGHTVADTAEANRALRDSGFKVGFHMMPGLPGSSFERDLHMFRDLFKDERFCPDYLKIYPTLVTQGTRLYEMWERGEYKPYSSEEAARLIAGIKESLPKWVRLQRIQRDIPVKHIVDGVVKSNIRQISEEILKSEGKKCRCIRCREIGHKLLKGYKADPGSIVMDIERSSVCGGTEHFISFEDRNIDALIGFLRLRFPCKPHRPELQNAAIVRELHVYGKMVPIGEKGESWQHKGYGLDLLRKAEELSREAGYGKIAVISGVGARKYYMKLGYGYDGPYMSRRL